MQQFERLVWDPKYTVHVEEIDAQHQKLFDITNNILDLYENGSTELLPAFQGLVQYSNTHFRSERVAMIESNYPGSSEQDSQHLEFINNIQNFLKSYKENDIDVTSKILSYLSKWVYSHTVTLDQKYG